MINLKNLDWIHAGAQKSLNLSLFEFKSYSEDVDKAIDKFLDIIEEDHDYEKIMDFHLSLTGEIEKTRKILKSTLRESVKRLKNIFINIFGFDKEFEVEVSSLEEQRNVAKKSMILVSMEKSQKNSEILNHTLDLSQSTIQPLQESAFFSKESSKLQTEGNFMDHNSKFTSSFFIKSPPNCNPLDLSIGSKLNKSIQTTKKTFFRKVNSSAQTTQSGVTVDSSTQVTDMVSDYLLNAVWGTVTCDICGERPMKGIRYKCRSCNNFDLCRACYISSGHGDNHDMIRMLRR